MKTEFVESAESESNTKVFSEYSEYFNLNIIYKYFPNLMNLVNFEYDANFIHLLVFSYISDPVQWNAANGLF